MPVTKGQMEYEWDHLLAKLMTRAPELYESARKISKPDPHPLFHIVPGGKADWEKG
jgi:hypothetical protein